jgi:hypothetical protein
MVEITIDWTKGKESPHACRLLRNTSEKAIANICVGDEFSLKTSLKDLSDLLRYYVGFFIDGFSELVINLSKSELGLYKVDFDKYESGPLAHIESLDEETNLLWNDFLEEQEATLDEEILERIEYHEIFCCGDSNVRRFYEEYNKVVEVVIKII